MKIEHFQSLKNHSRELLIVPLPKNSKLQSQKLKELVSVLGFNVSAELKRRSLEWKAGQMFGLDTPTHKQLKTVLLYCWDELKDDYKLLNQYRALGAQAFRRAVSLKAKVVSLDYTLLDLTTNKNALALLEGFELSNYSFSKYTKEKAANTITLRLIGRRKGISTTIAKQARVAATATKLARDLVNLPPKDCPPRHLVAVARQVARKSRLKLEVLNKRTLKKLGANGLLAVSQGSTEPPFLIKLSYRPSKRPKKTIALVGKGVTFDSGGLSIKPADGMMTMKIDMAGAAAVLATMQAVAELKLSVAVKAYIPTTENMISGDAQKPGDIIRAMNGKTIEVLNTDAEGRLILADALCLAEKDKPDAIIDLATLTGAVVVALGTDYAGLYATSEKLRDQLLNAGNQAGERLWPLPLAEEYDPLIKGSFSDIRNIGAGRNAGSITAALFLKHFVNKTDWAHLDIAGTAWTDKDADYLTRGGVGFGVRTLINYLANIR